VTSNHHQSQHDEDRRPAGALLAGVCADLAARLGWNVWAIRALFVFGLLIQTIGTGVLYILLAVILPRLEGGTESEPEPDLKADVLRERNERISDLERRFRDMERETGNR